MLNLSAVNSRLFLNFDWLRGTVSGAFIAALAVIATSQAITTDESGDVRPRTDRIRERVHAGGMRSASIWICGVSALLAMAGLLFAIFGPTISTSETAATPGSESYSAESTRSLFKDGIEPVTWVFVGLVAASAVVLGSAAIVGLLGSNRAARLAALVASASLLVLAVVSSFSIGLLLLPGALLAVVGTVLWNRSTTTSSARLPG